MSGFHNTTGLQGEALYDAVRAAKRQQDAVLVIFQARSWAMSPSDVWKVGMAHGRKWLLTSVRRAMSNLSAGDHPALTQTGATKRGPYGATEHQWELMERRAA